VIRVPDQPEGWRDEDAERDYRHENSQEAFVARQRAFEGDWQDYLAASRRGDQVEADRLRGTLERAHGLRLRGPR
jgi:hypothetical protein